ncbi:phosphoglycerate mutase-like protein 1 isoform X3 [Rhododendron vialii]|uniref:phosphoglycerate mutase-like protein 1 isoform X3 n=1 Tax=Rhododendron vialii TaxID=182163 RepID=UPI00265F7B6C|nr:phosphoglycerate mutase-like protein 1 isoform X3 [Rhododendron vialii]
MSVTTKASGTTSCASLLVHRRTPALFPLSLPLLSFKIRSTTIPPSSYLPNLVLQPHQSLTLSLRCSSSLSVSSMDCGGGPSIYPLHRCKTLHFVRHAQGVHNVEGEKNYKVYMSPEYFDAPLTPLGWQQVDNLRKHVRSCGLFERIELVITSPLLRTMQTAVGVFGGEGYTDRIDSVPLMVANAGNSDRPAISSLDCPPIVAVELCREHFGVHPCDGRRSISDYQYLFPAMDFSQIESDEDILWTDSFRETKEELAARGMKFMDWLWTRKEKEIAIVTHSGFLVHTLNAFGNDCHPLIKKEICKRFANCELRSMIIVDKSLSGSDPSTTNYPGKIPPGPDVPSTVADEKNVEPDSGST